MKQKEIGIFFILIGIVIISMKCMQDLNSFSILDVIKIIFSVFLIIFGVFKTLKK